MSQIQTIKDSTDIVELIAEKLQLQKSGSYYKANCPFHSEKTPSFFISEQMQRYKCFGCGKTGDVFNFLEDYDGMSFHEALQYLADRAGIKLENYQPDEKEDERKQILAALNLAKEYYHYLLKEHKIAQRARDYLDKRGTSSSSIKVFNLGYAPNSWDSLIKYLHKKKKISLEILEKAGLVIHKSGRYYDRFRNRVIFPLKNHRGLVVGFSGRTLDSDPKSAKYINSPETIVYHKKQMLYGYSELFQEIRKSSDVIVVEGEFDVISSSQHHINNIVAIKGSALTQEHARLLRRAAERVILALDSDKAGVAATKRAIPIVQEEGLELRVISLKGAKDVDELIQSDPKLWRDLSKNSISVYEFLIQTALNQYDPKTPEGKKKIIDELAPVLKQMSHAVERDFYIRKLAKNLHVRESILREDIEKFGKAKQIVEKKEQVKNDKARKSKYQKMWEYLTSLLFRANSKNTIFEFSEDILKNSKLETNLISILKQFFQIELGFADFCKTLSSDNQEFIFNLVYEPKNQEELSQKELTAEIKKVIKQIKQLNSHQEIERIGLEIKKMEDSGQEEMVQKLLRQIIELRKQT